LSILFVLWPSSEKLFAENATEFKLAAKSFIRKLFIKYNFNFY